MLKTMTMSGFEPGLTQIQLLHVELQCLPLGRDALPDDLRAHRGANQRRRPHVAEPEHEAEPAVPLTDHSTPRKQQRLRALLRPGQLREHDADHERLDDESDDALYAQQDHCFSALIRDVAVPVADRVLGLQAEEEATREVLDVIHTCAPRVVVDILRVKVAVRYSDQPPEDGEQEPAQEEAEAEHEQRPPPLDVDQGGDDVSQVAPSPLGEVALNDVQLAILEDDSFAEFARADAVTDSAEMGTEGALETIQTR